MRKLLFPVILVLPALFIIGCSTPPGKLSFDSDLPPEKTTEVVFADTIVVRQYNGIDVFETWYPKGRYRKNTVTLPAGNTTITFDINAYISVGNVTTHVTAKNVSLNFDFDAGKSYSIAMYSEGMGAQTFFLGRKKFGIAIWDNATKHYYNVEKSLKNWELGQTG